ncbi:peroxin 20 [Tricharina praecox]|uniref:peroxin 20 n=1 Tax=Tricharina praecox TaxID=43433 RepID=UPI00222074D6|nr:peroxin 20 [Tricharina praecox]KAI5855687.1 peroxin 20 [Tricharina praecox]
MAALCGPSNALSSLQKHTTADRTHQQDRFRGQSHQGSSQGFRSAQNPAWGDNEFDAFSSAGGVSADPFFAPQQPQLFQQSQAQAPAWATDFQRLDIGAAPVQRFPIQQQQQPQWGLEFTQRLQQREQAAPLMQQEGLAPATTMASGYSGFGTYSPSMDMGVSQVQQQHQQSEFQYDESAFERAFADAEREFVAEEEQLLAFERPVEVADKVQEKEQLQREGDDLARTAGQLLDSVQENTSAKFQNSNFLALMRKLRDHQVVVEGNDMVEAKAAE